MTIERAVRNRLDEDAYKISDLNVSGSWFAVGYSESLISHSEFWPDDESYKQVKFSGVSGSVEMTISGVELLPEDDLDPIEFSFAAKMQSGGEISVTLSDTSSVTVSSVSKTFLVDPQLESPNSDALNDRSWVIYRTNPVFVDKQTLSKPRVDVNIVFTPSDPSDTVEFANPVISGLLDHAYYSEAARNMVAVIPDHFIQTNGEENPSSAVTRFIDVAFSGLDFGVKAYRDYRFFTIAEGRDENDPVTLSDLVWPSDAGLDEAKWLAQFSGTEPVAKLSSTIDPSDPFVLDSSTLGGSDTLRFSTTGVTDPPLATTEVTRDFLRWQARFGYYGMNAGSVAALREAVKRVMVEPKEVTISLQHEGPFTVLIQTPWEQTYGASSEDVGSSSSVVKEAIFRAKPIGVKVIHELT